MEARGKRDWLGVVVPHTHWDRAWYQPFEAYRVRLVRTIDSLLNILESDPQFTSFTLDGQVCLLEDYLEIRADSAPRLRHLIRAGRLHIGPWYTLPDLFLAGGEAVVRNLQYGRRVCAEYGGAPMPVGYVPDSFGHFAQMPQILRGFGLDSYIFMRGLDAHTKAHAGIVFDWQSPDGSTVQAVNTALGYGGGSALGQEAEWGRFDGAAPRAELAAQRVEQMRKTFSALQKERTFLIPNGSDHMPPQPQLPALLREVEQKIPELRLRMGSYADFLSELRSEKLSHHRHTGDLLGNVDHPILSNVYSARVYLKQQNHRAQSLLVRVAEPLCAWMAACGRGPDVTAFVDRAWKLLLRSHAHDNICGCSADAVHREDEHRFDQVTELADTIIAEQLEALVAEGFVPPAATNTKFLHTDVWVFNPHPFAREFEIEQRVLMRNPGGEFAEPTPARALYAVDGQGRALPVEVLASSPHAVHSAFLETSWGRAYDVRLRVSVPALGYQLVHVYESEGVAAISSAQAVDAQVKQRLEDFADRLSFEFERDMGDTYTFGPVPQDAPAGAHLSAREMMASGELKLSYELRCSSGTLNFQVWLRPEGARGVKAKLRYLNSLRDGRLRALLRPGFVPASAWADAPFRWTPHVSVAPVDYSPQKPAYPGERPYPTHFMGDFLLLQGEESAWIATRGQHEYEMLMRGGLSFVALTLHRAVGHLSVNGGGIRACHAGPAIATPEAQGVREWEHDFAFGFSSASLADMAREALAFSHPAFHRELPYLPTLSRVGEVPRVGSMVHVENPNWVLSAFRAGAAGQPLVLRAYNATSDTQWSRVNFGFAVRACRVSDLTENWNSASVVKLEGNSVELELGPHKILTLLVQT